GLAQPWHWRHVGALASAGVGTMVMEATGVEPAGRISSGCLGLYDDRQQEQLSKLVRDVGTYSDVPLGIQLGHAGRKSSIDIPLRGSARLAPHEGGWQTVAPSAIAFDEKFGMPTALDEEGIARI